MLQYLYDDKLYNDLECGEISFERFEFLSYEKYFYDSHKNDTPNCQELTDFFNFMLPGYIHKCKYSLDISEGILHKVHMLEYYDFIRMAVIYATQSKYTTYYSVVPFRGWCNGENIYNEFSCLYIDIDDIGIDVYEMNTDTVIEFLKSRYNIPDKYLPNRVVLSGRGMHLYFKTYTFNDLNLRNYYMEHLLTFFGGDFSCKSAVHKVRVPLSYNSKNGVNRPSKLLKIHDRSFHITDLEFFVSDAETVENAKKRFYDERQKKSNATRAKNRASANNEPKPKTKKKVIETKDTLDIPNSTSEEAAPDLCGTTSFDSAIICDDCEDIVENYGITGQGVTSLELEEYHKIAKSLTYYKKDYFTPESRNNNLLKDLNNYYIRHDGNIFGRRNNFAFIYSIIAKRVMSRDDCYKELSKYFLSDFLPELQRIVDNVYSKNKRYKIRNTTIAEKLNFTQKDIDESYCHFSKERQQKAKNEKYKRKNDKRFKNEREQKKADVDFVLNNKQLGASELERRLNGRWSLRTIQRWLSNAD